MNAELLAILACPACEERPPLELRGEYLVCLQCRRAYPIRDDIPVLLVEEAIPLEQVEARMPNLPAEP
ncbi:MAG: hypothetical protein CFK49_05840 [Armatimonadetes bacterium JP3_11]|nr:MAG: hypothetical protein CFK48_11060 [Armatimonadetes bacterium CP1_7O]OYT74945.1 MAG: hypothetical protein CFK49_05840 [Armatimonadetes bacterium JP3_11]RMH09918.1 MAG: Trm112 family protein [Armatimonadota bacterium]